MNVITVEEQHGSGVYAKRDRVIVRGQGTRLWDEQGREYIDCVAGIGVANLGHCHPVVTAAIREQAARLVTCPELFYNEQRAECLQQLAAVLPHRMSRIFLCNSGSEAVEGALKFARLSTGRSGIIAAMRGFHGRTMGALSATHKPAYRQPFAPLVPGFSHVPFDNIERLEQAVGMDTAAVLLEVVQGEGGVRPANPDYLEAARRICNQQGAMLIIDEVQTGFGRTGRWFAIEHAGVEPDLMCLGKAIGGGLPVGAVAIGPRVSGLGPGTHSSTFGGNPLSCAAALSTLRVIENEKLVERAEQMGDYFRRLLQQLDSPLIREVRGLGLMVGVELKVRAGSLVDAMMERGVLALTASSTVVRFLPPLTITAEEIEAVVAAFGQALSDETAVTLTGGQLATSGGSS